MIPDDSTLDRLLVGWLHQPTEPSIALLVADCLEELGCEVGAEMLRRTQTPSLKILPGGGVLQRRPPQSLCRTLEGRTFRYTLRQRLQQLHRTLLLRGGEQLE